MEEKNLEELVKKRAEECGISLEEAASTVSVVMRIGENFEELWEKIRTVFFRVADRLSEIQFEEKINDKQIWSMVWDTRKKSQVILNKPKFVVLKIIK